MKLAKLFVYFGRNRRILILNTLCVFAVTKIKVQHCVFIALYIEKATLSNANIFN